MSGELKPCPFCGNDVNDDEGCFQAGGFRSPATPHWVVRCGNPSCNAETSAVNREDAITAWNTRHGAGDADHSPDAGKMGEDSARLDWMMRNISGRELREMGVQTDDGCTRAAIDSARAGERG